MIRKAVLCFLTFSVLASYQTVGGELESIPKPSPPPQKIEGIEAVEGAGLYLDGRVYLSGQPDQAAFTELRRTGLEVVVNVRTPEEVADRESVPFDEAAVVGELGMSYVAIPLGGDDHPYAPEAVQRLAEALATTSGPVLIHCGYGGRAAYLWIAYLVEYEGLPLESAMARGEAMMLKQHPVGRLLGKPTALVFMEDPAGESADAALQ